MVTSSVIKGLLSSDPWSWVTTSFERCILRWRLDISILLMRAERKKAKIFNVEQQKYFSYTLEEKTPSRDWLSVMVTPDTSTESHHRTFQTKLYRLNSNTSGLTSKTLVTRPTVTLYPALHYSKISAYLTLFK